MCHFLLEDDSIELGGSAYLASKFCMNKLSLGFISIDFSRYSLNVGLGTTDLYGNCCKGGALWNPSD